MIFKSKSPPGCKLWLFSFKWQTFQRWSLIPQNPVICASLHDKLNTPQGALSCSSGSISDAFTQHRAASTQTEHIVCFLTHVHVIFISRSTRGKTLCNKKLSVCTSRSAASYEYYSYKYWASTRIDYMSFHICSLVLMSFGSTQARYPGVPKQERRRGLLLMDCCTCIYHKVRNWLNLCSPIYFYIEGFTNRFILLNISHTDFHFCTIVVIGYFPPIYYCCMLCLRWHV